MTGSGSLAFRLLQSTATLKNLPQASFYVAPPFYSTFITVFPSKSAESFLTNTKKETETLENYHAWILITQYNSGFLQMVK